MNEAPPRSSWFLGAAPIGVLLGCLSTLAFVAFTNHVPPPDESRFSRTVIAQGLAEPMQIEFDLRGRVYWIERPGGVKRLDETTGELAVLGTIPVSLTGEAGLVGVLLDREFETSRQIYFYYSAPGEPKEMRLSRIRLGADDRLDPSSEIVLMRWPFDPGSHMGGGMLWDEQGNLYLSVGDNTNAQQYAPLRFTAPGGAGQDGQRTAANSNDYRGKILRIHPEPDGTYTIPSGNLVPPGTPGTRPEIYTMGNRNPWRLSIDSRTGFLHWGEIGPDAGRDSVGIGPMGYDELNVARGPGNFGWPYFIGYDRAYHRFDYATSAFAEPFDPARPVNLSPNNTGLRELPPTRAALVAYPYGVSAEYPVLGSGGRAAVGGPVFHRADFPADAARVFPEHYEGKWFVVDYVRNWIVTVTLNAESSEVDSIERFLPGVTYTNPIDIDFGPRGDLYVVEYGGAPHGRISRVEYTAGNRPPRVSVSADRTEGATPMRVRLSAVGTVDPDGDELRYEWVVTPNSGGAAQRFTTATPTVTLTRSGAYTATLTATDPAGVRGEGTVKLVAGNEPPVVALEIEGSNRSFWFPGSEVRYRARASDPEDRVPPEVRVTAEYVPSGISAAELETARELAPDAPVRHLRALTALTGSDCRACHTAETRAVGPAFREIAARYRGEPGATEYLARKIVAGGGGVWGGGAMPPHPGIAAPDALALAEYVMSFAEPGAGAGVLPREGSYPTPAPAAGATGAYVLRALATDRGANGIPPITRSDLVLLRHPKLAPETADVISPGISYAPSRGDPSFIVNADGASIGFRRVDLTGIRAIEVGVLTRFYTWSHFKGGSVEVRLGSPTGRLVGTPILVTPPAPLARAAPPTPAPTQPAPAGGQTPPPRPGAPPTADAPVFLGSSLEKPVSIPVSGVSGIQDVYVVFRNPDAGPADALFLVTSVEFRQEAPTPERLR